jgi:2-polyprenyl-6-methoxyphenol hydroxylase-like FAD-dependent oxidoreductase
MEIVVVGAGIGGLATALSLHAAGFSDVRVLEAAGEIRSLGVGLNILPNAVRELTELGLAERLAGRAVATAELALYHRSGGLVWREPRGIEAGYRWPQLSIHRGVLQAALLEAVRQRLGPAALRTGARVVRVAGVDAGRVEVSVADRAGRSPSSLGADLVVGADGLHSAIRAQLHPAEGEPCTNGLVMWRGTTWAPPFLTGRSMVVIGDDRHRLVMYPIVPAEGPGRPTLINWVTALPAAELAHPATAPTTADRGEVRRHLTGWSFPGVDIAGLVAGAGEILQYPMQDRDPLPRWVFGRVVLLGDAAHPMYPAGSNGATQAIVDARVLAHRLATIAPVEDALAAYEADRRPATAQIQRANRRMGPERVIDLAHQRAPDGFEDIHDVIPAEELARVSAEYAEAGGFSAESLNARPSHDASPAPTPGGPVP